MSSLKWRNKMKKILTVFCLLGFLAVSVTGFAKESDNSHSFANIDVDYYDNGYLKEASVEKLRVTQMEIQATTAYEFSIPIAGYMKWHLGENDERHPQRQGYDEWYGITNTTVPVDPTLPGAGSLDLIQQKILYAKGNQKAEKVAENTLEMRSLMDRELTKRSVGFIETHAEKEPFFLFVPFTNPHHPVVPHPDFVGKSKGGAYTDALMEIDYNTGLILNAIDKAGIRENTIVVYFSDNGHTLLT
jgi:Sulfatase